MPQMRRLIFFSIFTFAFVGAAVAQDEVSSALRAELREIEAAVSEIRDLGPLEDTTFKFLAPAEAEDALAQQYARYYPPDRIAAYHYFLQALDLAEKDIDMSALLLEFLTRSIAGFYDPENNTMVVILPADTSDIANLTTPRKLVYAHEYMHALQDQHFDLLRFSGQLFGELNFDAWLAQSALVEGDARLVDHRYLERLRAEDEAKVEAELRAEYSRERPPLPERLPPVVQRDFWFPYESGLSFAIAVQAAGGWAGMNEALAAKPPSSSEEIMHPQQYLDGETARAVNVHDDSALLEEGWQRVYNSAVGEFYLRQHLATQLPDRYAERVAMGWGGDRLRIYVDRAGGEMMWVWYQVWDRPYDAEQFATHYPQYLDSRYAKIASGGLCWSAATTHCFARIKADETRVSMAQDYDAALALLQLSG